MLENSDVLEIFLPVSFRSNLIYLIEIILINRHVPKLLTSASKFHSSPLSCHLNSKNIFKEHKDSRLQVRKTQKNDFLQFFFLSSHKKAVLPAHSVVPLMYCLCSEQSVEYSWNRHGFFHFRNLFWLNFRLDFLCLKYPVLSKVFQLFANKFCGSFLRFFVTKQVYRNTEWYCEYSKFI